MIQTWDALLELPPDQAEEGDARPDPYGVDLPGGPGEQLCKVEVMPEIISSGGRN